MKIAGLDFDTKALKSEKRLFSRNFQRGRKPFFWQNGRFWNMLWYTTGEVSNIGLEPNWPEFVTRIDLLDDQTT